MHITTGGYRFDWNGSHTVNVTDKSGSMDVFTFGFELSSPKPTDFLEAAYRWLSLDD